MSVSRDNFGAQTLTCQRFFGPNVMCCSSVTNELKQESLVLVRMASKLLDEDIKPTGRAVGCGISMPFCNKCWKHPTFALGRSTPSKPSTHAIMRGMVILRNAGIATGLFAKGLPHAEPSREPRRWFLSGCPYRCTSSGRPSGHPFFPFPYLCRLPYSVCLSETH